MAGSKSTSSRKPRSAPLDLVAMSLDYRAGILSDREIGTRFGCSHTMVQKYADKLGWERDLKARINARADKLVARATVAAQVAASVADGSREHELATVLANGAAVAAVRLEHRAMIAEARGVVKSLLRETRLLDAHPEAVAMVHDAISTWEDRSEGETMRVLAEAMRFVTSLPQRTNAVKTLLEAMRLLIGMEREAFGLDTVAGTDGRPMVIIRDFTGRGSPEAPPPLPQLLERAA